MSNCPSRAKFEQFLCDEINGQERETLELHVESCSSCQQTLDHLSQGAAPEENPGPSSSGRSRQVSQCAPAENPREEAFLRKLQSAPPPAADSLQGPGSSPGPTAADISWPDVPGYEIEGELGRGGMAVVYTARQLALNRRVALKMILAGGQASAAEVAHFRKEAETLAGLRHPNIVQIYDVSLAQGRPCLALELVEGISLARALEGNPQPAKEAAGLVETLARAIHYAHQHGIVHRDLKPANILLAADGKAGAHAAPPAANWAPKIADFGLAKRLNVHWDETRSGIIMGTPCYMAPEQAAGHTKTIGPAADLYALGAILYELLTGRPPFKGETVMDTLQQVVHQDPVPPGRLQPRLPRDLETICLKCLAKEPARRYASAAALADDLGRFQRGQPILARPTSTGERAWKWARRHPAVAGLSLGIALVTVAAFVIVLGQLQAEANARNAAVAAEGLAEQRLEQVVTEKQRADDEAAIAKQRLEQVTAEKQRGDDEAAIARAVHEFLNDDLLGQANIASQFGGGEGRDKDIKVRTLLDRASKKLDGKFAGQPLTEAALRVTLGSAYSTLNEFDEAERHLKRAVQIYSDQRGADHESTLESKSHLAVMYWRQDNYPRAEQLFQEVLKMRTRRLGPDHPLTLTAKTEVATQYLFQEKYRLAESLLKEVLHAQTIQLAADDLRCVYTRSKLAALYQKEGKYDLAEPLYREVLRNLTALLGKDHLEILSLKNNLALLYKHQGKYDRAEALFQEVVQAYTAVLTADHPEPLKSRQNLAQLYMAQGKFDLAESLYREVLQVLSAKFGQDHPTTLHVRNDLANLQTVKALTLRYQRTRTTKGEDHIDTLLAQRDLADGLAILQNYAGAERLFRAVLDGMKGRPREDPIVLWTEDRLTELYVRQDKMDLAHPLLAGRAARGGPGHDNLEMAFSLERLGRTLISKKQYVAAEPVLRECLTILEKKQPDHWAVFEMRSMVGVARLGQKDFAGAEPLLLAGYEGLKQREIHIPASFQGGLVKGLSRLVELYDAWGKGDQAAQWRRELAARTGK